MALPEETAGDWVTVLTTLPTLPLPSNAERPVVETERLVLRTLTEDDLPAIHGLRSRSPVMRYNKRGAVDTDLEASRARLAVFLPPTDVTNFTFAVCLRADGDSKLIGMCGVYAFHSTFGWPEIGYLIHDDYWGKGYATEFLRAFVKMYAALPRPDKPVPLRVTRDMLPAAVNEAIVGNSDDPSRAPVVDEIMVAIVADANIASQKVLLKTGFEEAFCRTVPDDSRPEVDVLLHYFQYRPGRAASGAE